MVVHVMYKTELALLSRLVFVDYALMAQSYKLLNKSVSTYGQALL